MIYQCALGAVGAKQATTQLGPSACHRPSAYICLLLQLATAAVYLVATPVQLHYIASYHVQTLLRMACKDKNDKMTRTSDTAPVRRIALRPACGLKWSNAISMT